MNIFTLTAESLYSIFITYGNQLKRYYRFSLVYSIVIFLISGLAGALFSYLTIFYPYLLLRMSLI